MIEHSLPVHVGLCLCAAGDEQQEFVSGDSVFPPASSRWASLTSQCVTSTCGDNSVCVCVFYSAIQCALISSEPKPVYAQPGQPDVDLPVSPADAPVPSVTNDDSILRCVSPTCPNSKLFEMLRMKRP